MPVIYNPRGRTTKELMGFASSLGSTESPALAQVAALIPFYAAALGDSAEIDDASWPVAVTEVDPGVRVYYDLSEVPWLRVQCVVFEAAPPNARLAVQYSVDAGGSFAYLDGSQGPYVMVDTTGDLYGEPVSIVAAARGPVLLRLVALTLAEA